MPNVDLLFGNEDEIACFAGMHGLLPEGTQDTSDEEFYFRILESIQKAFPLANKDRQRQIVVTRGSESIVVSSGLQDVCSIPVPKLEKGKIIDTNGAGDSFVGGFLSQLSIDHSIDQAVKAGIQCSRIVLQQTGCSFPEDGTLPDPNEI